MRLNVYGYIFVMAAVTYLIRLLPFTLLRRPIKNRFVRSFLYYVPYVTLAVMTFPAILSATDSTPFGLDWLCGGRCPRVRGKGAVYRLAFSLRSGFSDRAGVAVAGPESGGAKEANRPKSKKYGR